MTLVAQFVDKISATATVRLDINDGTTFGITEADLSPPPLRRAVVASMLTDGNQIPSTAYENRALRLTVEIVAVSEAALAAQLQTLHRELARPTNILKWQSGNVSAPVFFRTFRATDYVQELTVKEGYYEAILTIPAEPFAYGLRVDSALKTINNTPIGSDALSWFMFSPPFAGDVETPLMVRIHGGTLNPTSLVVGTYREVDEPTGGVHIHSPAETASLGADTTLPGNDANMAGTGSNYARTTFATTPGMVKRISTSLGGDVGLYRVLARHRRSVAGDTIDGRLQFVIGASTTVNYRTVRHPAGVTGPYWVDYGLLYNPAGAVPESRGYDGTEFTTLVRSGPDLQLQRVAGSGNVDTDFVYFLPVEHEFAAIDLSKADADLGSAGGSALLLDGPQDAAYVVTRPASTSPATELRHSGPVVVVGSLPVAAPGMENRLYVIDTTPGTAIGSTTTVVVSYWPRYLHIAA